MSNRIPEANGEIPGRLNQYDRAEILAACKSGVPVKQLASEYRRTEQTIRKIIEQTKYEAEQT